jgi:hypothetical protein
LRISPTISTIESFGRPTGNSIGQPEKLYWDIVRYRRTDDLKRGMMCQESEARRFYEIIPRAARAFRLMTRRASNVGWPVTTLRSRRDCLAERARLVARSVLR